VTTPTIGSNVEEFRYKNLHFLMWDIGGQESLRASWSTYYVNTKAVILVVDSTDHARLHLSREELHRMMDHEVRAVLLPDFQRGRADHLLFSQCSFST